MSSQSDITLQPSSLSFLGNAPDSRTIPEAVVIGMTLSIIVLATIIGNLFVILAVIVDKDLRRPQYILILSLAVADTLVGCAVTPIATVYELQKRWTLGAFVCDFWTSCDVLVCTSSILHLVSVS
jgi:5-hydroxytryptamine receptor 1